MWLHHRGHPIVSIVENSSRQPKLSKYIFRPTLLEKQRSCWYENLRNLRKLFNLLHPNISMHILYTVL